MLSLFHTNAGFIKLGLNFTRLMTGLSFVLLSHSIALSAWANQPVSPEIRLAQTQLTTNQIPPPEQLADAPTLVYGDRVRGALNVSSIRHQGRRFAIYRFQGEAGQLVRINLVGGLASDRPSGQLQTGSLLINPVAILVDPNGEIIAQQPEQSNVANALIRMNLPVTGTYNILVTSATLGGGGRFTLTLQQPER